MAEQEDKIFRRYIALRNAVLEYLDRSWLAKEGHFEVNVTDERGKVEGSIKGGDTFRTKKVENGEE